jgi:hypothetical protein
MGVYLINVHLTGVHLMGVYFIGVYLMDVHLMGVYLTGVCPVVSTGRITQAQRYRPGLVGPVLVGF